MKKHLILTVAFFLLFCTALQAGETIRVLTFNIRISPAEVGKINEWKNRRDMVADIIRQGDYDFVGVQEAVITKRKNLNQVEDLKRLLPEYALYTRSREKNEAEGESTPILYRKDRWEMDEKEHGVFWLSDNENKPAANTWKNACPRTVVWGKFHELKDGKRTKRSVYFINTHFDHKNGEARGKSAVRVAKLIKDRKDKQAPAFLTGDLNVGEDSPVIAYLIGKGKLGAKGRSQKTPIALVDAYRAVNPKEKNVCTFHGFKGLPKKSPEKDQAWKHKIDFVFSTKNIQPTSAEIIHYSPKDGVYPSDHYPIKVEFAFPSKKGRK